MCKIIEGNLRTSFVLVTFQRRYEEAEPVTFWVSSSKPRALYTEVDKQHNYGYLVEMVLSSGFDGPPVFVFAR